MHTLDENIRVVANEGPGSKRFISPLNIEGGELIIDEFGDRLLWSLKTNNKLAEPNIVTLKSFFSSSSFICDLFLTIFYFF